MEKMYWRSFVSCGYGYACITFIKIINFTIVHSRG